MIEAQEQMPQSLRTVT